MNNDIASSCKCFGLYDGENIIGFIGILHQPHSKNKKLKRVSRLVILPDYQGIGLGMKFLNIIAKQYNKTGWDFCIDTSAKNLIYALNRSKFWLCYGYNKSADGSRTSKIDKYRKVRSDCYVGRFKYIDKTLDK